MQAYDSRVGQFAQLKGIAHGLEGWLRTINSDKNRSR